MTRSVCDSGLASATRSRKTRLWFCSTGYLVRLVAAHPQALKTHTHIVVDEVHERICGHGDADSVLLLRQLLVQEHRPTIRVVLMSASHDTVCMSAISTRRISASILARAHYTLGGDVIPSPSFMLTILSIVYDYRRTCIVMLNVRAAYGRATPMPRRSTLW